jgi:predicted nucleic acid-binding protein
VKLLVDTSVWSLALRRKNTASLSPDEQKLKAELVQAIQDGRVAMLGLLRQELLSGIKEKAQFDKVKAALDPYLDEPINTADHDTRRASITNVETRALRPARSIF